MPEIGADERTTVVQMRNPAGVLRARITASMHADGSEDLERRLRTQLADLLARPLSDLQRIAGAQSIR
jgi:hypothetical protein